MKLTENVKRIFVVLGTILGIGLMIFFFGRPVIKAVIYIFSLLSPFIFGYIISRLINPLADKLQKKFKLPRVISVIFVIVVTLAILIGIIGGIGYKLITELRSFMVQLPEIIETVKYTWEDFISRWSKLYVDMPDSVQSAMDNIYQGFIVKIRTFASGSKIRKHFRCGGRTLLFTAGSHEYAEQTGKGTGCSTVGPETGTSPVDSGGRAAVSLHPAGGGSQ